MKKLNISLMMLLFTVWLFQACSSTRATGDTSTSTGNTTGTDTTTANTTGTVDNTDATNTNTNTNTTTTTDTTRTSTSTTNTGTVNTIDASQFVVQAVSLGMTEVELAVLAQKKAQSESVQNYASMLIRDHTKSNAQLRSLAMSKNITLPPPFPPASAMTGMKSSTDNSSMNNSSNNVGTASSDTSLNNYREHLRMLSQKTGSAFDKEYIRMMIDDHSLAISLYERASTMVADNDIKEYASKTLPTLRVHLDRANSISKKLNIGAVSSR